MFGMLLWSLRDSSPTVNIDYGSLKGGDEPEKAVGWLVPGPLQWAPQISDPAGWQKEFADHRVGQNPVSSFPVSFPLPLGTLEDLLLLI